MLKIFVNISQNVGYCKISDWICVIDWLFIDWLTLESGVQLEELHSVNELRYVWH